MRGVLVLREEHRVFSAADVASQGFGASLAEYLHFSQGKAVFGLRDSHNSTFSSPATDSVDVATLSVPHRSTLVFANIHSSTVESPLTAILTIMDDDHVDGVCSLEIDLPPTVPVVSGMGRGSPAVDSVGVTIDSSLWYSSPTNTALFGGTSL